MEEVEAKEDGEKWLFAHIVVICRFTKNPDSYPANSLKETPRCFYFLGEKSIKINSEIPKPGMW